MKGKRKRYEAAFKARVAIEAIKEEKTIQQIAKEYEIHPTQVSEWKQTLIDKGADLYATGAKNSKESNLEKEKEKLHAKIGEQAVEIDFLRKKSKQLKL